MGIRNTGDLDGEDSGTGAKEPPTPRVGLVVPTIEEMEAWGGLSAQAWLSSLPDKNRKDKKR